MSEDPQPVGLPVAVVARRLGVAPATVRTWDRRYGLGPGRHESGRHRRYTPVDLARLEHLAAWIAAGLPTGEAAALARALPAARLAAIAAADPRARGPAGAGPGTPPDGAPRTAHPAPVPARGRGGGAVLALPAAGPTARGLARSAQSFDPVGCAVLLREEMARHGVEQTWDAVLAPVFTALTDRARRGSPEAVAAELQLVTVAETVFGEIAYRLREPVNPRPVLLAVVPGEASLLLPFVLAAALAEHRVTARVLGPHLPVAALASAVRRIGPCAVVLHAGTVAGDPVLVAGLPRTRPAVRRYVSGAGWPDPAPAPLLDGLSAAVAALVAVAVPTGAPSARRVPHPGRPGGVG